MALGTQALASKDYLQLAAVAEHRNTPTAILLDLARSDDPAPHGKRYGFRNMFDSDQLAVAREGLRNPNAPVETNSLLAKSRNEYVLAGNESIDTAIATRLAADGDEQVRFFLAGNRTAPRDVLEKLTADPVRRVASHARYEPERRR